MSELISGRDALIALANGEKVECTIKGRDEWVKDPTQIQPYYFIGGGIGQYEFHLKPRTITINGIEVPAPFEPKDDDEKENSYVITLGGEKFHWRASSDYKQVVSALRSVFKPQ